MAHDASAAELVLVAPADLAALVNFLEQAPDAILADVAHTCARRWCSASPRVTPVAVVAFSVGELLARLRSVAARVAAGSQKVRDKTGAWYFKEPLLGAERGGRLAFVFPGAASFYPDMLHDLAVRLPGCRTAFDELEEALAGGAFTPSSFVFPPAPCYRHDADVFAAGGYAQAMVATYCANAAVYRLLDLFGIRPQGVTGFAGGDLSALAAAGYFGDFTGTRGRKDRLAFLQSMYKVVENAVGHAGLPKCALFSILSPHPEETDACLAAFPPDQVAVAMRQSPRQRTLAVAPAAEDAVLAALGQLGVRSVRLTVDRPFNTAWCAGVLPFLRKFATQWVRSNPALPVYSCGSAAPLDPKPRKAREAAAMQWAEPVRFDETIRRMHADGFRVFVEAGPRGVATAAMSDILHGDDYAAMAADAVHRAGWPQLLNTLGALAAQGAPLDPLPLFEGRRCRTLDFDSPLSLEIRSDSEQALRRGLPRLVLPALAVSSAESLGAAAGPAGAAGKRGRVRAQAVAARKRLARQFSLGAAAPLISDADTVDQAPGVHLEIFKEFTFARTPFLADTAVGASRISYSDPSLRGFTPLLMMAAVELMAELAQELAPNRSVVALDDVLCRQPLVFADGRLRLYARAERVASADPAQAVVKVLLRPDGPDAAWTWPAIEGTVVLAAARPDPVPVSPDALRNPGRVNWTGTDIYPERLYAGESLRAIRQAALWDRVGLDYEVEMLSSARAVSHTTLPLWQVNPLFFSAVLDGFPLWRSRSPFGGASFAQPCRLRRLVLYASPMQEGARFSCYLRLTGVTPKTQLADIVVSSGNGVCVAELRGYEELVERVPAEFGRLLLAPAAAYLTRPVEPEILGAPATPVASAMITDVPYATFERNGALWLKTVSQMVLHGAERHPFAEMPGTVSRRTEWLFGRIAAKEAVRRFMDANYQARWTDADVQVWADGQGKPHALGEWQDRMNAHLDLAIAHTAQFVVAVVAANARVGVDVEARGRALSEEFVHGVFGPEELDLAANALDAPATLVGFWCAKEAVSKALGTGIRFQPRDLTVESFMAAAEVSEISLTLNGAWLEAFPVFRGRTIRVTTSTVREHILSTCFIPESLMPDSAL